MKIGRRIAVLGAGKIGQAIIGGLLQAGVSEAKEITAVTAHPETLQAVGGKFPVRTTLDGPTAAKEADIVIVSVKPQTVRDMLPSLREALKPEQLVVSTVASTPISFFEAALKQGMPVIRTMPNTPCMVRSGMTAIAPGRHVRKEHLELAEKIFGTLGRCVVLEEKHMDAVTGLSGSGPAYVFEVIEALSDGGVRVGLPRDVATRLAAQTVLGAAEMVLATGDHPAALKDAVTSPGGTTIAGLHELERGGLRAALMNAVVAATHRSQELGGR